jgi:hypothetical protein
MMKCPYLVRCAMSKCGEDNKSYIPSLFELQKYCDVSKNFKKCSFFQSMAGEMKIAPMQKCLDRNI